MNTKLVKDKTKLFQVYLGGDLLDAFQKYVKDNYPPGTRAQTAIFRRAIMEFLKGAGYYGGTKDG